MFKQIALNCLILAAGVWTTTPGWAQQQEVLHGTPLPNMYATGIIVGTSKGSDGVEILRVRATSETAAPLIKVSLPPSRPFSQRNAYPFVLKVTSHTPSRRGCSSFPDDEAQFEDCFSQHTPKAFGSWLVAPLPSFGDPEAGQLAVKSTTMPKIYGRCLVILKDRYVTKCDLYFEQGGYWHELETSGQALDNPNLFRCAGLELRNAVWPAAPSITDLCGK